MLPTCFSCVEKVKAHQQVPKATAAEAALLPLAEKVAWLNDKADLYAGKGREVHEIKQSDAQLHKSWRQKAAAIIKEMTWMLSKLPRPAKISWPARRVKAKTPAVQAVPGRQGAPQTFKKVGPIRWQCTGCLRRTSVWEGPLFKAPCGQVSAALQHVASAMPTVCGWQCWGKGQERSSFAPSVGPTSRLSLKGSSVLCAQLLKRQASGRCEGFRRACILTQLPLKELASLGLCSMSSLLMHPKPSKGALLP